MKRINLIFIILIGIATTFTSCEKETIEKPKTPLIIQGEGIKLNKEQNIYDLLTTDVKSLKSEDTLVYQNQPFPTYEIEIEGDSEEIGQITPGSVLYIPHGDRGGILVYVYEVTNAGNSGGRTAGPIALIIKGIQATLDMYFNTEQSTLSYTTQSNRTKTNSDYADKVMSDPFSLADFGLRFESKYEADGFKVTMTEEKFFNASFQSTLWKEDKSYINVSGALSVQPTLDFFLDYEPVKVNNNSSKGKAFMNWLEAAAVPDIVLAQYKDKNYLLGNLKQIKTAVYTDIDRELTFKMHLEKKIEKEVDIPIGNMIVPGFPVSAEFELSFVIDFSVLGKLDFETYAKQENEMVIAVKLDRDLPDPVWYYKFDSKEESGCKLMAEIELTTGIKLVMAAEVYVLGVLGPEVKVSPFIEASANIKAIAGTNDPTSVSWFLDVDAGIKGSATLNLAAFHIDKLTVELWAFAEKEWRKTQIYHAPKYLLVEDGNMQTGVAGQVLPKPIIIGAYDSRDKLITYLPVPVHLEPQHGSTEPSGLVWTIDGEVTTNWTLGNVAGKQLLHAHLKDGANIVNTIDIEAQSEGNSSNPDGLIAHYPLNGNANDASGNGYHGSVYGATPATDRFGNANNAYFFDGVNDWIEAGLNIKEPTGSISLWFKAETSENSMLFCQIHHPNTPATLNYHLNIQDGRLGNVGQFDVRSNLGIQAGAITKEQTTINEWHHLVCIWGQGGAKLYLDGELQGSSELTYYDNSSIIKMGIGCYNGHHPRAHFFHGIIDDFKVFNYQLSGLEITDLYTEKGWTGNQENNSDILFNPDLTYGSMTDIDGNTYKTIVIGTQTWMAENLRTTKYNDGAAIPLVTDNSTWAGLSTPAYSWYNNEQATYGPTYGALYNWYTVNTEKLCPTGWHVPSDAEWKTLEIHLGMSQSAADGSGWRGTNEGGKMKEAGTTHWVSPNTGATNSSGFTALPGGCRYSSDGFFGIIGRGGYWWSYTEFSTTSAWYRRLGYDGSDVGRSFSSRRSGFSVRCLRD